ncbi:hypothetical protein K449DRAFT_438815 [Hypoxylon sp. EC38]|nr:hypothetical protein K449DRAFT_438815 [Hypoxylon sp. EC38]
MAQQERDGVNGDEMMDGDDTVDTSKIAYTKMRGMVNWRWSAANETFTIAKEGAENVSRCVWTTW